MIHTPVLLQEVLEVLDPKPGERVLDVTVGLGGHARGFLEKIGPGGALIGIDADWENLRAVSGELRAMSNAKMIHANFRDVWELFKQPNPRGSTSPHRTPPEVKPLPPAFDIIFADLGLSSPHLDDPSRGFTYTADAPLDMRYDRTEGKTAADILGRASEVTLRDIFKNYGELREAAKLAKVLVSARRERNLTRSTDLRDVALRVYGKRAGYFLPQIFQTLRIAVNDELGALQALLAEAPKMLTPGGRFGVIAFHSLDDRMVKQAFRMLVTPPKHPLTGAALSPPLFELLTKRPIVPSEEEVLKNPRSRSARLRAILRLPTPPRL